MPIGSCSVLKNQSSIPTVCQGNDGWTYRIDLQSATDKPAERIIIGGLPLPNCASQRTATGAFLGTNSATRRCPSAICSGVMRFTISALNWARLWFPSDDA